MITQSQITTTSHFEVLLKYFPHHDVARLTLQDCRERSEKQMVWGAELGMNSTHKWNKTGLKRAWLYFVHKGKVNSTRLLLAFSLLGLRSLVPNRAVSVKESICVSVLFNSRLTGGFGTRGRRKT